MAFYQALSWHDGEERMHTLTRVPHSDNPTVPGLPARYNQRLAVSPLIALGVTDEETGEVWCSAWGGDAPIAQVVARGGVVGMRANVDAVFDPVARLIYGTNNDGEIIQQEPGKGRLVSALSIHLEDRDRVKLFGKMLAGALSVPDNQDESTDQSDEGIPGKLGGAQLVLQITQSLGNCPKYLNKKIIHSYLDAKPRLMSKSVHLSDEAIQLIYQADLFFISSKGPDDMDTNHRGGDPGFLRVQQPQEADQASVIAWPEYSGNNLYQTLGNITHNPHAGLCIPNFTTGDVLYVTGIAEVLIDDAAGALIAKTKLAVKFSVTGVRHVRDGLGFRGKNIGDQSQGRSPYNPRIRYLRSEKHEEFPGAVPDDNRFRQGLDVTAKLIKKTQLTPTIYRYRFSLSDSAVLGPWKPGQYVALDFSNEMYMGYSHMRDSDPKSLNDDYMRTFTVASPPGKLGIHGEEFELVVRNVGSVTNWLTWQRDGQAQIGARGFGGEFRFDDTQNGVFIAAGIGITPLLGQIGDISRLKVLWSVGIKDVGLVLEVLKECSDALKKDMTVFLTGEESLLDDQGKEQLKTLLNSGEVAVERRRLSKDDLTMLEAPEYAVENWYLCTAPAMRQQVQQWVPEKSIIFENFDY